jgi:hypothetical protein
MIFTLILIAFAPHTFAQDVNTYDHRLWYDKPAAIWLEALPIGNSKIGGMIYGGAIQSKYTQRRNLLEWWSYIIIA